MSIHREAKAGNQAHNTHGIIKRIKLGIYNKLKKSKVYRKVLLIQKLLED